MLMNQAHCGRQVLPVGRMWARGRVGLRIKWYTSVNRACRSRAQQEREGRAGASVGSRTGARYSRTERQRAACPCSSQWHPSAPPLAPPVLRVQRRSCARAWTAAAGTAPPRAGRWRHTQCAWGRAALGWPSSCSGRPGKGQGGSEHMRKWRQQWQRLSPLIASRAGRGAVKWSQSWTRLAATQPYAHASMRGNSCTAAPHTAPQDARVHTQPPRLPSHAAGVSTHACPCMRPAWHPAPRTPPERLILEVIAAAQHEHDGLLEGAGRPLRAPRRRLHGSGQPVGLAVMRAQGRRQGRERAVAATCACMQMAGGSMRSGAELHASTARPGKCAIPSGRTRRTPRCRGWACPP